MSTQLEPEHYAVEEKLLGRQKYSSRSGDKRSM